MQTYARDMLVAAVAALGVALPVTAQERPGPRKAPSGFAYVSEPGDPVGQGATTYFPEVSASRYQGDRLAVGMDNPLTGQWGTLAIALPEGQALRKGRYVVAPGGPALWFGTENRYCDSASTQFEVEDVRLGGFGYVEHLRLNFEQRCTGAAGALWGDLVITQPPKPKPIRVQLRIEPTATRSEPFGDIRPHFVFVCSGRGFGLVTGTLHGRLPDGTAVHDSDSRKLGCDRDPKRLFLEMSRWPGLRDAVFTVHAAISDLAYAEWEGDAAITVTESRRIRIR